MFHVNAIGVWDSDLCVCDVCVRYREFNYQSSINGLAIYINNNNDNNYNTDGQHGNHDADNYDNW